jgi:hypothetical protein
MHREPIDEILFYNQPMTRTGKDYFAVTEDVKRLRQYQEFKRSCLKLALICAGIAAVLVAIWWMK